MWTGLGSVGWLPESLPLDLLYWSELDADFSISTMKKTRVILIVLVLTLIIGTWFFLKGTMSHRGSWLKTTNPTGGTNLNVQDQSEGIATPGTSSTDQYLAEMERLKELPLHANARDRRIAQMTSWWGKPLDPKAFWKNKTIWLDIKAKEAANRVGRLYPPIPFGDNKFSSYSETDITGLSAASEGDAPAYHFNNRERAYWSDFERSHPLPPEELEIKQVEVESGILDSQHWKDDKAIFPSSIAIYQNSAKDAAIREGYPREAFSGDALYWSYVFIKNQQYENNVQTKSAPTAIALAHNAGVDLNLITNALTADQVKKANSWKIAYLKRLKGQNLDQSYLYAYMQTWGLSSNEVFGLGN